MSVFSENQKQRTIYWLIHNQAAVKELIKGLEMQRTELFASNVNKVFHDDISQEFYGAVKTLIQEEISRQLGFPIDIIKEVLDDMNLEEYLKV